MCPYLCHHYQLNNKIRMHYLLTENAWHGRKANDRGKKFDGRGKNAKCEPAKITK